ncbi:MAG: 4Fe-4S dicluster domain-containing protein [Methanoregulaceae archaeon]
MEVYVDRIFCNGCGTCVDLCSMGVFQMAGKWAEPFRQHLCVACFRCRDFCPTKAIAPRWIMRVS